jgi:hypothetical protein
MSVTCRHQNLVTEMQELQQTRLQILNSVQRRKHPWDLTKLHLPTAFI